MSGSRTEPKPSKPPGCGSRDVGGELGGVRRAGGAFNRRDIDAMGESVTDDFEFIPYLAAVVEKTTT
jgi:hypothetical protein